MKQNPWPMVSVIELGRLKPHQKSKAGKAKQHGFLGVNFCHLTTQPGPREAHEAACPHGPFAESVGPQTASSLPFSAYHLGADPWQRTLAV